MEPAGASDLVRKIVLTILALLLIPVLGFAGSILGMMSGSSSGPNGAAIGGMIICGGSSILLAIFLIILIWFHQVRTRFK